MSIKVVPIPTVGAVGSRPRKEPIYDTERWSGGTALPSKISIFTSFNSFVNSAGGSGTLSKQFGRDTNLSGQQGLPAAHHHYWYGMRCKIRALEANLGTEIDNKGVLEEMNRARELSYAQFRFASSELITVQLDEVPSGAGPAHVATTFNDCTVFSLPSGVPTRSNAKDVTISGRPVEIVALESFKVEVHTPESGGLSPTVDLFVTFVLEGLLLKGITG